MSVYEYTAVTNQGKEQSLGEYEGNVLLIVNTASRCGFAPQFKELQELYEKYHSRGFYVLGFPCNQFGNQEPGTDEEIRNFCEINYRVTFPLFQKVDVKGENQHPLFKYLTQSAQGLLNKEIKWNFTKFLVDRQGNVVKRFAPTTSPKKIAPRIEALLDQK
ncbi:MULTISPECIES: glutathione peroxidase [Thermoactinomyces]|jgi:glutathione peroxidase|uniref:Glutathione peroxidase n=1 Tax=Thermoactinomyces vulgaris TaxID=2026 RepID=A0ABS0QEZ4_THEVU|nr:MULTISPECIES: glutathione peroxidase [Thermoactinomyces]KFZ41380.1 glutathione peroxidase [Thermoactinomyces sp. Gus2-1]KYQ87439.1 glutathione peroxidase [Thermoactinomyces sp. AS95]MBA4551409.1 glutathione peroxidase [Thermoactinomyces vulgaris]MBA4595381.1 glutathione peroxidase [Thermoactinomyces vulgaris]MBH8585341.1 glutathione peroxidase [Thermoactinomyces sp. CICC 10520]